MEDLITQFMEVTGVDRERAEFYIALSANQLEVALATFYEASDNGPGELDLESVVEQIDTQDAEESLDQPETTPDNTERKTSSSSSSAAAATATATTTGEASSETLSFKMDTTTSKSKNKIKTNSRITTLSSLQNKDDSSDDEGQQAFYAGGSVHSGQQVLGPNKKKKNDIVNDMFKKCQEQSVPPSERSSSSSSSSNTHNHNHHHHHGSTQRPSTFSGTGYKLGQTTEDTEVIPSASGNAENSSNSGLIVLKLWRDGFTVNDRELRSYTDPENHEFLAAIKRGEIPMEIRQEVQGVEARLDMEDHRHEEYVPAKPKVMAFAGKGHKLGSPSPATVGMTVPSNPADQTANETLARSQLNLSNDTPVTTIQIRLADGQNIREQFNLSHTIGDIRRFIVTMRPQYANLNFNLLTSYPTKELTEDSQTIQDASLQNSAIMQRLK